MTSIIEESKKIKIKDPIADAAKLLIYASAEANAKCCVELGCEEDRGCKSVLSTWENIKGPWEEIKRRGSFPSNLSAKLDAQRQYVVIGSLTLLFLF